MDSGKRVLVVDGDVATREALVECLRMDGYAVEAAADGFEALGKLDELAPHLVLTDLGLRGMDGVELLTRVHQRDPHLSVVVMTASGDVDTAVGAMRAGACDYVRKPIDLVALSLVIAREVEHRRLWEEEVGKRRARLTDRHQFPDIIGSSAPMQDVLKTVAQISTSRATVLITGESGTGKELIAAAIHEQSARSKGPFVKLNCAALAESLLESELFGHERGAFTGAQTRREGRFLQANGGTLFLDEIGDITPAVHLKLLRFLQEREFQRVGGNQTISVDVRIIVATNKNLAEMVSTGKFREDLYYRLNVINLEMPALRNRPSDIPLLAGHFLRKYATDNDKQVRSISDEAVEWLMTYRWPGNVRELENVVERAMALAQTAEIGIKELPAHLRPSGETPRFQIPGATMYEIERYAITKTLEATGGSTNKAAGMLNISVRKIQYKLHDYQNAATLTLAR